MEKEKKLVKSRLVTLRVITKAAVAILQEEN